MRWRKRGRDLLRPHELLVLDAVRLRLDPPAAELFGHQIESIAMVQRHLDGQEVNFYPTRRGPQRHDPDKAFPNRSEELRIGTVTIIGPTGKGKAEIYLVSGHLFQIAFTSEPKHLGDPRALEVVAATIHADPMGPAVDPGITHRLDDLDTALRAELESMWATKSADDVGLASPADTYRIHLSDGTFLVLAQLGDTSFLVAPIDPPRPGVRRYWPDGELSREYPDMRSAIADR
jgi:hypothetical protein